MVNVKVKKLVISGALSATLVVSAIPNIPMLENTVKVEAATLKFKDVGTKSFAYDAIYDLVDRGVVYGYKDGTFRPGVTVTRGQFATMLARALNLPKADSNFKDLPKTKELYDGVSRAAKAGIIKGYTNGYVYPDKPVSRADIAVMIDRAMQLKGKYNETVNLSFKDANSIPAYAIESVKRMTKYGIIQGKSNNTFAPGEFADRATSSVFIYRMLNVLEGKPSVPSVPPVQNPGQNPDQEPVQNNPGQNPEKDYRDMSYEEIKALVGEHVVVYRHFDSGIRTRDLVKEYYDRLHDPVFGQYTKPPKEYFDQLIPTLKEGYVSEYFTSYPKFEVISYNGKAYRNSPLFPGRFIDTLSNTLEKTVPTQPNEDGQFLIDIHTYSKDFATYTKGYVKVNDLTQAPARKGNDYIINLKEAFKYAIGVSVENNGLTLTYNGNKVEMTNGSSQVKVNGVTKTLPSAVEVKNGSAYGPIRAIAEYLGLQTREMLPSKLRLEIANYPLEKVEGVWD